MSDCKTENLDPLLPFTFSRELVGFFLFLYVIDQHPTITDEAHAALTEVSIDEENKAFNKWHRDNKMSLLVMKRAMTKIVRGEIPSSQNAPKF